MTLNCNGKILDLSTPVIMGIVNATPDSFFKNSRVSDLEQLTNKIKEMQDNGASIIDIGALSSRPGSKLVSIDEELDRLLPVVRRIRNEYPDILLSIDCFRPEILKELERFKFNIINDIRGARDFELVEYLSKKQYAYILMHMKGVPESMNQNPKYENVTLEILDFFIERILYLKSKEIEDIIIDPGFGFGKTIDHNYELISKMSVYRILDKAILAGLSRKSMIYKVLNINADQSLNGTTILNYQALLQGAKILRVHDVKEAKECIRLYQKINNLYNRP